MLIILTGLMGSGKTSVGKKLSSKLHYNFIDLDALIEKKLQKSIADIFNIYGEKYFRKIEFFILSQILPLITHNTILSLGGGAFTSEKNCNICLQYGYVIWLNTNIEIIYKRLINNKNNARPLLKNNIKSTLFYLLKKRIAYYQKANYTININNENINVISQNIIKMLNLK